MANPLRTDIDPSEINIDTIQSFQNTTSDTILEIQTSDMVSLKNNLNTLKDFKINGIYPDMRRFLSSLPTTGQKGMLIFLRS